MRFRLIGLLGIGLASFLLALPAAADVPAGAIDVGYTELIIDERPAINDIAPDRTGAFKWFLGQWYDRTVPRLGIVSELNSVLALTPTSSIVSAPHDFSKGLLPTLSGAKGFYVEYEIELTSVDPDHWPAVWLMPVEHNAKKHDSYPGDKKGFERWMELDVDEGGFGPGLTGTVHSWFGVYPYYRRQSNPNNVSPNVLDRRKRNVFGASFNPTTLTVTWWLNGKLQMRAGPPFVPEVARKQNFYLIISAQSHGRNIPYKMLIHRVRAFGPPTTD